MPKVYFVRDGRGDQHTDQGTDVPLPPVVELVSDRHLKYSAGGPTINPQAGEAKWHDAYKHVVIEIGTGETSHVFPKVGYYYIPDLTPTEAQRILGIVPR